jgi:acetyl-CoA carboxylase biotin carboxyl carrier protein
MSDDITLEEIKSIIELIRQNESITHFSFKYGDVEISLTRGEGDTTPFNASPGAAAPAVAPKQPVASAPAPEPPRARADIRPQAGEIAITSPMVGTFYRCPKPGDPPFVDVGAAVKVDTVLCIIEVMKLMNSLEAKVKGVVTRILVDDSQPVEHGQPLMFIKLDGN